MTTKSSERLMHRYDRAAGCFDIPKAGPFWTIISEARRRGLDGEGVRIAVMDSGFDLSIPALAAASGERVTWHVPSAPHSHGTAVALLVLEAAPRADLDLHVVSDGGPVQPQALADALAVVEADIICFSSGEAVDPGDVDFGWLEPVRHSADPIAALDAVLLAEGVLSRTVRRCPMTPCACVAASQAAARGALLFAAAGNDDDQLFCPALADPVISVGFLADERILTATGAETAAAGRPDFGQSIATDVMVPQLDGIWGSSFAAPLMAGAAALGYDRTLWPDLIAAGRLAGDAAVLQRLATLQRLDADLFPKMEALFAAALRKLPWRAELEAGSHWSAPAAIVATSLFVNAGLHRLAGRHDCDGAERLLRAALHCDPQSADAMANMAASLLFRAERGESPSQNAAAAAELWAKALTLRPDQRGYAEAREKALSLAYSIGGAP